MISTAGPAAPPCIPGSCGPPGPSPLSFSQQRLWFLNEFQPGAAEYNSALALRLLGALDVPTLTRALRDLVARHESLRTTFDEVDGKGMQVVHPTGDVPIDPVVLAGPDELDRVLAREYARPFDLHIHPMPAAKTR